MNSNVYAIHFGRLAYNFLLVRLRKPAVFAFVKAALKPLEQTHSSFLSFRDDSLYKVRHTSQKVYIEAVLNDIFDPMQRRIRIANTEFKQAVYFYEPEERREVFFYEPDENKPVYFYDSSDLAGAGVDFTVLVPPDLQPGTTEAENAMLTRMRGLVDYYKLYSKNYNIVWQLSS